MLAGHYGAAYALRSRDSSIPLWGLFLIVQAVDIAFFLFSLVGIEDIEIFDGERGPLAMNLVSIPISHSLLLNLVYAGAIFGIAAALGRRRLGIVVALAWISHWVLDLFVHVHDLPLTPAEEEKVGLALWETPAAGLALELAVLIAGGYLLHRVTEEEARRRAIVVSLAILGVIQVLYVVLPGLEPAWLLAIGAELLYAGLAVVAWWVERPPDTSAPVWTSDPEPAAA